MASRGACEGQTGHVAGVWPRRVSPRALGAGLALGTAAIALPAPALACTCAAPATVSAARDRADRVFLGAVERFEVAGARRVATFRVSTVWKGPADARLRVTTGAGDGDCGVHFVAGLEYLVFAGAGTAGEPETSICSRTAPRREARDDLNTLGPGTPVTRASGR